jgi:hypothetical protein
MKKLQKKLSLKRVTVADLTADEMDRAKGGIWYTLDVSLCPELCLPETQLGEGR